MVSVNTSPGGNILRDVYQLLIERTEAADGNTLDGSFALWMCPDNISLMLKRQSSFVVSNYTDIASLAFFSEHDPSRYISEISTLEEGLKRVSGRPVTHLDAQPAPFRYDAVALLGLALGARRIGGKTQQMVGTWMHSFINPADTSMPEWKRAMFYAALCLVGLQTDERDVLQMYECNDIKLAINAKVGDLFKNVDLNSAYQQACHKSIAEVPSTITDACRLQALYYISNRLPAISISTPTLEQVITLLNNIPAGLKRWPWEDKAKTRTGTPQKWDLQNEYHVQSLVYFLLTPIFSDIEQEFYLDTFGHLNPRADIGLPSMRLIIEIKFIRPGTPFANIVEEVASDASLYFAKDSVYKNKYSRMIVVLWDDSARSQEHQSFKSGVLRIENIEGAVVISRPGDMPIQTKKAKKQM